MMNIVFTIKKSQHVYNLRVPTIFDEATHNEWHGMNLIHKTIE